MDDETTRTAAAMSSLSLSLLLSSHVASFVAADGSIVIRVSAHFRTVNNPVNDYRNIFKCLSFLSRNFFSVFFFS